MARRSPGKTRNQPSYASARSAGTGSHPERSQRRVTIVPIETATLGDRSYLAQDGEVALVVDPQRDIVRILTVAPMERAPGSPTCSRPISTTTT